MKNFLLILLLFLFPVLGLAQSKGLDGTWNGTLEAGGTKLRIVVTVTKSDSGAYAAKFESVDQGATVPFDTVTLSGDNARFEVKAAGIVYDAVLNADGTELTGKFTQGGQEIPLNFKRNEPAASAPSQPAASAAAP